MFRYRVKYQYIPNKEDELELREGEVVFVSEICDDGWYIGYSEKTKRGGAFPGNYVEKVN